MDVIIFLIKIKNRNIIKFFYIESILLIIIKKSSEKNNIIYLTINGNGNQRILNNSTESFRHYFTRADFDYNLVSVDLNKIEKIIVNNNIEVEKDYFVYDLTELINNVTIIFNTKLTDLRGMFEKCSTIISIDLSDFDTSEVTDMSYMFYEDYALSSLNINSIDTSNVVSFAFLFGYCTSLTSLDLSNLNTSKIENMRYMFIHCDSLS